MKRMEFISNSANDTIEFAKSIGKNLRGGECIELISDVGGGKTTFVRGLAVGAGSSDHVSSPTFTVSKLYDCPAFIIAHFDFYRLQDAGLIGHEIEELANEPSTVIVVEWAEVVNHVLPKQRLRINIKLLQDERRKYNIKIPQKFEYLLA